MLTPLVYSSGFLGKLKKTKEIPYRPSLTGCTTDVAFPWFQEFQSKIFFDANQFEKFHLRRNKKTQDNSKQYLHTEQGHGNTMW